MASGGAAFEADSDSTLKYVSNIGIFQRWNGEPTQGTFSNVSAVEDDVVTVRFGLRVSKTFVDDKAIIKRTIRISPDLVTAGHRSG